MTILLADKAFETELTGLPEILLRRDASNKELLLHFKEESLGKRSQIQRNPYLTQMR
jgi:hypothetical protein